MPNGIDNTRRKHFRMESIQAEENVRKIKQQQIRVRTMYARDTYTNCQAHAGSSACRSGSKDDPLLALPHSIMKRTRYTFGRRFEPVQRPAGQVTKMGDLRAMSPISVYRLAPQRGADVQRALCTPEGLFPPRREHSAACGKGHPVEKKLKFCRSNSLKI